jgi:hypothetical protein
MEGENVDQNAGKRSKWLAHVKQTMRKMKKRGRKVSLATALKEAKRSYKGGGGLSPQPIAGGRRHKTRRGTRRH